MEYVGLVKNFFSEDFQEDVSILKYVAEPSEANIPYCLCDRCKKPIKRVMYVVQSDETDVELAYLGAECIKYVK